MSAQEQKGSQRPAEDEPSKGSADGQHSFDDMDMGIMTASWQAAITPKPDREGTTTTMADTFDNDATMFEKEEEEEADTRSRKKTLLISCVVGGGIVVAVVLAMSGLIPGISTNKEANDAAAKVAHQTANDVERYPDGTPKAEVAKSIAANSNSAQPSVDVSQADAIAPVPMAAPVTVATTSVAAPTTPLSATQPQVPPSPVAKVAPAPIAPQVVGTNQIQIAPPSQGQSQSDRESLEKRIAMLEAELRATKKSESGSKQTIERKVPATGSGDKPIDESKLPKKTLNQGSTLISAVLVDGLLARVNGEDVEIGIGQKVPGLDGKLVRADPRKQLVVTSKAVYQLTR